MAGATLIEREERAIRRLNIARFNKMSALIEGLPVDIQDRDEDDWVKLSGDQTKPYTEAELKEQRAVWRKWQYKPAGRNILQALQDYIIGRKAEIEPVDQDEKVTEYWDAFVKASNWDLRSKEIIRRTFRDGEVFLREFKPKGNGGHLQYRFVNCDEIKAGKSGKPSYGIETDSDDIETPISYHREWTGEDKRQESEDIPAKEMIHIKILCDSDQKRGVSFFIGIGEYMGQYEKWLKDRIELNRVRHIWNVVGKIEGATPISDIKGMFDDVTGKTPQSGTAKKRVPKSGSILLNKGIDWDLKSLNINARDTKDDGRAIQLMIALGTNIPEFITRGDASNANYASTMVAESPFVKAMESWQDFFEKPFKEIFRRVIEYGIGHGPLPTETKKIRMEYDRETGKEKEVTETSPTDTDCTINFAVLLHRDLKDDTEAYVNQVGTEIVSKATAREKLGYDNEEELDRIDKEDREEQERAKQFDLIKPGQRGENEPTGEED